jgi:hypothetical protein
MNVTVSRAGHALARQDACWARHLTIGGADERTPLTRAPFQAHRPPLHTLANRKLGSPGDAAGVRNRLRLDLSGISRSTSSATTAAASPVRSPTLRDAPPQEFRTWQCRLVL